MIHVTFYHLCRNGVFPSNHWKFRRFSTESENTWENIRYCIELRCGCISKTFLKYIRNPTRHKPPRGEQSFVLGYEAKTGKLISASQILPDNSYVCCLRKPMHFRIQKPYVPFKFLLPFQLDLYRMSKQDFEYKEGLSEEETKLDKLMFDSKEYTKEQKMVQRIKGICEEQKHASYWFAVSQKHPPVGYVCLACGAKETHYSEVCPSPKKTKRIRAAATGIPKTMLRKAITAEELERAMETAEGNLVVFRRR